MNRRGFLLNAALGSVAITVGLKPARSWANVDPAVAVSVAEPRPGEDLFAYLERLHGGFGESAYKRILGAANAFKEGDAIVGVAAADEGSRHRARQLLSNTPIGRLDRHPPVRDDLTDLIANAVDPAAAGRTADWTLGELRAFLLDASGDDIQSVMPGLSSHAIGSVVKLMDDAELIRVGAKLFNPLPGSRIGAAGYLGARIQPNSPTDNVEDIRWQVFDGWSYAVGDVVLGTNPVSSEAASVAAIEETLQDLLETFELTDVLPHCVLSHIDVQAEVEAAKPGSTALWFQSIAGSDSANETFDISVEKMLRYAAQRSGPYGLYFETGQGADFTNGHGHGFDMVLHEARKYGFARALSQQVAVARQSAGAAGEPWVHLNDVAGFIGPEVFRSREQLVRCCLEDIVMGKLHGLCIGLDVCSTLHMDVSLEDLDWCLEQVMPANPAYLMALPTKIDPMLGYLTTGFHDHLRLRKQFGFRVNDRMWEFFRAIGVVDAAGRPAENFGDPNRVYLAYRRRKGDTRPEQAILDEGRQQLAAVRARGVFVAEGHGPVPEEPAPGLAAEVRRIYDDAKQSIWAELEPGFVTGLPAPTPLQTRSVNRSDYILHPETGEHLDAPSARAVQALRERHAGRYDVQLVISDGLNALAIMEPDQLGPFLADFRERLEASGLRVAPEHIVVRSGRVRAGYRIGEALFANLAGSRAIAHVIGERPGTGHRTFSVYMTAPSGETWGQAGAVDHNITRVVSGIARTALPPLRGAEDSARLLGRLIRT